MSRFLLSDEKIQKRFLLLLILLIGLARFINLGYGEIQEWDEALYAVRAKSIAHFGDWLDQTDHSVGKYYSSSHPPLFIWLTAVNYKVFGVSNFTTRFWSAAFGALLMLLVYHFGRKLFGQPTGFLAAVIIGTIPLFTSYSRLGQLDIAYLFLLTLSIYFLFLFLKDQKGSYLILAGVVFGLCLTTKSLAGLSAIPIAIVMLLTSPPTLSLTIPKKAAALALYVLIGFGIASPWYVYMEITHGADFPQGFIVSQVLGGLFLFSQGLGTNIKELGYFYFPNQLLVRFPLAFVALGFIILKFAQAIRIKSSNEHSRAEWFLIVWFFLIFLFFTLVRTKVVSYTLPMLIPLSILTAHVIERLRSGNLGRKFSFVLLWGGSVAIMWSAWDDARLAVKALGRSFLTSTRTITEPFLIHAGEFVLLVLLIGLGVYLILRINRALDGTMKLLVPSIVFIFTISIFSQVISVDDADFTDGARELAGTVSKTEYETIYYLYTPHYTEGMNPQLAFYLDGVNCGWKKGKRFLELRRKKIDFFAETLSNLPLKAGVLVIVEKSPEDQSEKSSELVLTESILSAHFSKLLETKRYILYGNS